MRYEGTVYRPPSEAYSLIVQATIGCAHNRCSFCSMYKDKQFRIRSFEEIRDDLVSARNSYRIVERIFLADGDALAMPTEALVLVLDEIKRLFPECSRVGIYAAPADILRKSEEELELLKAKGIGIMYLGVESGSDEILKAIDKGATAAEMIEAGLKVKRSGIKLSTTLIAGIGGRAESKLHAKESAKVISTINPDYLGILTLMLERGTKLYEKHRQGEFELLSTEEVLRETRDFIEQANLDNCIFRGNHASNYVNLAGTLPYDKAKIIKDIDSALGDKRLIKHESCRGL